MEAHYNGERSRLSAVVSQEGFKLVNWCFYQEFYIVDFHSIINLEI
jgi:hypothetical protein